MMLRRPSSGSWDRPVSLRAAGSVGGAAAVIGIWGPPDEPAVGEFVEGGDDVAAVDAGAAAQSSLAGRAELLKRGEQPVVVAAGVRGGEPVDQQPVGGGGGSTDEPTRRLQEPR